MEVAVGTYRWKGWHTICESAFCDLGAHRKLVEVTGVAASTSVISSFQNSGLQTVAFWPDAALCLPFSDPWGTVPFPPMQGTISTTDTNDDTLSLPLTKTVGPLFLLLTATVGHYSSY